MRSHQLKLFVAAMLAAFAFACGGEHPRFANTKTEGVPPVTAESPATAATELELDVPYVPTPNEVVNEMLAMAEVTKDDILYDLGSGDGRIPITAAQKFGTRGVGIDLDPVRVKEANANAEKAKVTDKVRFIEGDIFKESFSEATVVTLYLLPSVNLKLKPTLLAMKPGTRVVSHNYDMDDWVPEKTKTLKINDVNHYVYFWRVPEKKN
jgi:hypothetical protein